MSSVLLSFIWHSIGRGAKSLSGLRRSLQHYRFCVFLHQLRCQCCFGTSTKSQELQVLFTSCGIFLSSHHIMLILLHFKRYVVCKAVCSRRHKHVGHLCGSPRLLPTLFNVLTVFSTKHYLRLSVHNGCMSSGFNKSDRQTGLELHFCTTHTQINFS